MSKLKKSKYVFIIENENGNYIIYSSLNGVIIKINNPLYYPSIIKIMNNDLVENEDTELFDVLKRKGILINEEDDESLLVRGVYEEKLVRNNVLEVMLIVTRKCNFRCVYCGQSHLKNKMSEVNYKSVLNFIKKQIKLKGYKKVKITFFGGEPLLESEKICDFLCQLRDSLEELSLSGNEVTYEAGMSTNGYLLSPKVFNKLVDLNCNYYQISIDGMPSIHDSMRPLTSGAPSWEKIINNLKYMISTTKNFNVTLRTNFNAEVAESLVEFYEYVGENLNDNRLNIYYETIKDHGNEDTPDTLKGIEELIFDIDICKIISENNLICNNATTRLMPCSRVCYASKPNFFLFDEKNNFLKCSFDLDNDKYILGTLNENGELSYEPQLYCKWVYNDYLNIDKCNNCKALPLCFGKKCPKMVIENGDALCDLDIIHSEIEGLLKSYI